jgi:hypothetical protein
MIYFKKLPYFLYFATLAILSLAGCKTLPHGQVPMQEDWHTPEDLTLVISSMGEGREQANLTASEVDSIIRGQWSKKSISALKSSRQSERSKYTMLFILATRELMKGNGSCEILELVSVRIVDDGEDIDRQRRDSTSTLPAEIWKVDVCGTKETHHIDVDGSVKIVENPS